MKLEKELCEALISLRENRSFKVFLDALREDEKAEIDRSLQLAGPQCHRAQGAALKCREYIKAYEDAPTAHEKFKELKPK